LKKILILILIFAFASTAGFSEEGYIKKTPSAYTYKAIYDQYYQTITGSVNNYIPYIGANKNADLGTNHFSAHTVASQHLVTNTAEANRIKANDYIQFPSNSVNQHTTYICNTTAPTGVPSEDAFRIMWNNDFNAPNNDYLVFEKTDGNSLTPDGGIAFVNTGIDGIARPSLIIRGSGDVLMNGGDVYIPKNLYSTHQHPNYTSTHSGYAPIDHQHPLYVPFVNDGTSQHVAVSAEVEIGNLLVNGTVTAAPDIDTINSIGKWKMGYVTGWADYAVLAQYDNFTAQSYALMQIAGNNTYLNSVLNSFIYFNEDGTGYARSRADEFNFHTTPLKFGSLWGSEDVEITRTAIQTLNLSSDYGDAEWVVSGNVTAQHYRSIATTGQQPYECLSTTVNTNLNADYLDGYHSTAFAPADNQHQLYVPYDVYGIHSHPNYSTNSDHQHPVYTSAHANATASAAGFLPILSNVATEYLNGIGGWSTVSAGLSGHLHPYYTPISEYGVHAHSNYQTTGDASHIHSLYTPYSVYGIHTHSNYAPVDHQHPEYTSSHTEYVPYTGATSTLNLGLQHIVAYSGEITESFIAQHAMVKNLEVSTHLVSKTMHLSASTNQIIFNSEGNSWSTLTAPSTSKRIWTLQDITGTIYSTDGTDVTVADGGTGRSTGTTAYALIAAGTTATDAQQSLASVGVTGQILASSGADLPTWRPVYASAAGVLQATSTLYGTPVHSATIVTALTNMHSLVATGTQPYQCTSTTVNTNLNADYLDGFHSTNLASSNHSHSQYAPVDNSHATYTPYSVYGVHTHSNYQTVGAASHNHSTYSPIDHQHPTYTSAHAVATAGAAGFISAISGNSNQYWSGAGGWTTLYAGGTVIGSVPFQTLAAPQALQGIEQVRHQVQTYQNYGDIIVDGLIDATAIRGVTNLSHSGATNYEYSISVGMDSYTSLLAHFNGTTGETPNAETGQAITYAASAAISSVQKKFGTASLLLNGTTQYVTVPDNDTWNFGTNPFTLEGWFYPTTDQDSLLLGQFVDVNNNVMLFYQTGYLKFASLVGGVAKADYRTTATCNPSINNWHHIAFVRDGTSVYIFLDGVPLALTVITAIGTNAMPDLATTYRIGADNGYGYGYFKGYIDEARVSKGVARWVADFSAQLASFSEYGAANTNGYLHTLVYPMTLTPQHVGAVLKMDSSFTSNQHAYLKVDVSRDGVTWTDCHPITAVGTAGYYRTSMANVTGTGATATAKVTLAGSTAKTLRGYGLYGE